MSDTHSTILRMAALFSLLVMSSFANANLIVNGSFEDDPFTANGNFELGLVGNDVTGWFIPNSNGIYPWGVQDGAFGAFTPFGTQWLVLGLWSSGFEYTIQQTLTGLTIGATYDLSFAIASETGCCSQAEVSFLAGSSTAAQSFIATDSGDFWTDWTTQTMSFIAIESSVTLQFKNIFPNGNGFDLGLDNVIVEQAVGVPEPSTLALLGLGLAGLGLARRRKQV